MNRVYTNLAVLDVTERGFAVLDVTRDLTLDTLQAHTEAKPHLPG
jgi:3-oxoadipate CoA-transferase beta subunit